MMNRPFLIILAALALGSAGFGLAQLDDARKLRQNLAALDKERSALQKQIWDLQKRNGDLERRLARPAGTGMVAGGEGESAGDAPPGGDPAGEGPRSRGRGDFRSFAALMSNPATQKLLAVQQKAGLDSHYAALFKQLNLSPADLEKFKNLLVEKQSAVMDVIAAARAEGLTGPDNRDQIRQLVQNAQSEVDNTIRSTLGDAAYSQYQSYEATVPQRNVVSQLEQRLSYSAEPLTDTQSAQLVQILAQNAPAGSGSGSANPAQGFARIFTGGGGPGAALVGGTAPITNAAITQAQGILSAQQLAALQTLQQEQQAAALLRQQFRNGSTPTAPPPADPGGG